MVLLYIIVGIVSIIYVLFLCLSAKFVYEDYNKGKAILLIPKGSDKLLWLFFPIYLPFVFASYLRIGSNRRSYKKNRKSVLQSLFSNDEKRLLDFEKYIISRCGAFDISFYSILDSLKDMNESDITCGLLYDIVSKLVQENNIKIEKNKISQVAYDLLSCFYRKKYNESDTRRIMRLRKAGYNVRPSELGRDEDKHDLKCDFEGKETECPKDCYSCAISIKTEADKSLIRSQYAEAIEKYKLALQIEPRFAEAWNNLASAYGSMGDHSSALNAYLRATDLDPMYGKALWGAAMALRNLGREAEAMAILNDLLKYYDYEEANVIVEKLKSRKVSPIPVCRGLESNCVKQLSLIAKNYGLDYSSDSKIDLVAQTMFDEVFNPFFNYLISYYKDINILKLAKVSSEFMLLAGMASNKYFREEKTKVMSEGIGKILSKPKGFYAMDEYCCEYLGIQYEPDNGNVLSPCIGQMVEEAVRIYSDIINQVKTVEQIQVLVHDLSSNFFMFGYNYSDFKLSNKLPLVVKPKNLSKKELLSLRLKTMANDPTMKTIERSQGAMCYSIREPEKETYRCLHCGCTYQDTPGNGVERYFNEIRKMGYDCKLERWCRNCCVKQGLDVSDYTKSRFVFFIRLDSSETYRITAVYSYHLQVLYQFFKNENMYSGGFGRTEFVGESPQIIEQLLGIKID